MANRASRTSCDKPYLRRIEGGTTSRLFSDVPVGEPGVQVLLERWGVFQQVRRRLRDGGRGQHRIGLDRRELTRTKSTTTTTGWRTSNRPPAASDEPSRPPDPGWNSSLLALAGATLVVGGSQALGKTDGKRRRKKEQADLEATVRMLFGTDDDDDDSPDAAVAARRRGGRELNDLGDGFDSWNVDGGDDLEWLDSLPDWVESDPDGWRDEGPVREAIFSELRDFTTDARPWDRRESGLAVAVPEVVRRAVVETVPNMARWAAATAANKSRGRADCADRRRTSVVAFPSVMSAKSARTEPGRRSARRAWLPTALVAFAFFALAAPWGRFRDRPAPPPLSSAGVAFNNESWTAPTTVTKQIAQIHVGDWVLARNPEVGDEERLRADDAIRPEDNPSQWRAIGLLLPKKHGGFVNIELLRPAAWVDERRLATGAQIDISLLELGASGLAQVLWVGPCPEIGAQPALGCRVVTGTFAHSSAQTFNLTVAGANGQLDQTIGVTGNHPIWSEDKQEFVPVNDLAPGEHLVTATGDATRVISVLPRPGPEPVYNLEVDVEHVYYVSSSGVLAHNAGPSDPLCLGEKPSEGPKEPEAPSRSSSLYEVGRAKDLRKNPVSGTQVNHAPRSRQAESLLGDFNPRNKVGNEAAIRLPNEEHIAVSAAQGRRTAPASARHLLADELGILRQHTNAPNSALRRLIDLSKKLHPWDYLPLHRTNP